MSSLNIEYNTLETAPKSDKFVGKNGAQIFHELMKEHQVTHMFGYPGGAILPVFDAIFESKVFKFILSRHERGAGHMAEGFARASGKPGVVLVTSGPGATNTVTPLQDALMDGTPLLVFCGQVPTTAVGTDAFQEADVTGITRPCTKWNVLVKDVRDLPRRINEAFHIATTGRPGPVLVDLPKDVTAAILKEPVSMAPHLPGYTIRELGTSKEVARAAEMINKAKKPILYVGQGAIQSGAWKLVRELAEKGNIPCTTTLQGLGAFDEMSPKSLHMLGMHGSAYANYAMQDADLIISIGARFDDRVTGYPPTFAPEARAAERRGEGGIIHFDIAPENIGKTIPVTLGVVGDALRNLEAMLPMIERRDRAEWFQKVEAWKKRFPFRYRREAGKKMKPQAVIEEFMKQTKGDAIVTTGVGQHQMWAAQFYKYRTPRQFITSGGLGTMGYGLPSAIGAKLAKPDSIVVDIDGDGSLCMTGMELITAAEYGIGVKVMLLNNDFQGMVKQWQDLFYKERYSHTAMRNPKFKEMAEAMNCTGLRCDNYDDLPKTMDRFLKEEGPVLCDFVVEKDEHVYPMVPAGRALNDMELGVVGETD